MNTTPGIAQGQQRVCGWCGIVLTAGGEPATHGMCDVCARYMVDAVAFTDPVTQRRVGMLPVVSSNIAAAGWYAQTDSGIALVRFASGTVYRYEHVPRGWWLGFLAAPSKGQYFSATLRADPARFQCARIVA